MNFTCDWPRGSGACGKEAKYFIDQESCHRPVCLEHAEGSDCRKIELIDPAKVPKKWPTQVEAAAERLKVAGVITGDQPPKPRHAIPPPPQPERPLRDLVAELATSILELAKEKVESWRKT